jgi:predicted amidohydrolase
MSIGTFKEDHQYFSNFHLFPSNVCQAVGQLRSTASVAHNLRQARTLIRKAHEAGAKAIFLPEASDYITTGTSTGLCKSVEESEFVLGLQGEARKYKLPINVGVHEPAEGGKVKNTLLWIDESGVITQRYQKLHLFDVDIKGGPQLKESNGVERGTKMVEPFDTPIGKMGLQICFDLRFPEPGLMLRARGAQVIAYPSAFTTPTGKAGHWEVLLRARAIETQSYIIAAAQVGVHDDEGKRRSYGHAMVVDPWGQIVAELGGDAGSGGSWEGECDIAVAEIDLGYVDKIRREIPLMRRTDVYPNVA